MDHEHDPGYDRFAGEETSDRDGLDADVAALAVRAVAAVDGWSVSILVPTYHGLVEAWAPFLFWSQSAAWQWLADRSRHAVRASVRECEGESNAAVWVALVDRDGREVLVSEPIDRSVAGEAAALLAAEFRSRNPERR